MRLHTLHESANVIDWRGMVHLMPSDFQQALAMAEFRGAMLGAACAFGVALCVTIAAMILTERKSDKERLSQWHK